MTNQKLDVFASFAERIATLSNCKRRQVGAIICDSRYQRVEAVGFNGPARGLPNDQCRNISGDCGCAHAEANAIAKLRTWDSNLTLISTLSPCEGCANMIANSSVIAAVIYLEKWKRVDHLEKYPFTHFHLQPKSRR